MKLKIKQEERKLNWTKIISVKIGLSFISHKLLLIQVVFITIKYTSLTPKVN